MSASPQDATVGRPARGEGAGDVVLSERTLRVLEHRRARGARRRGWLMRRALVLADVVGLTLAALAIWTLYGSQGDADAVSLSDEASLFALTVPVWLLTAKLFGLYDFDEERADHSTSDELARVFLMMTVGTVLFSRAGVLLGTASPEDAKLTAFWMLGIVGISGARVLARAGARRSIAYVQNTVVVGAGDIGQLVARKLTMHTEYRLNLVGFVDADPRELPDHLAHVPVLGPLEDLKQVVRAFEVDRVIFAFSSDAHRDQLELVRALRDTGVQVDLVPRLFEVIGPKVDIHTIEGMPLMGLAPVRLSRSTKAVKRAIDVVGGGAVLLVLSPLLALLALAIKLDSPGPVLFRQTRLGKDMAEFPFLKFRTMRTGTDDSAHRDYIKGIAHSGSSVAAGENGLFKLSRADAVTRVGRWLRRTSLDELPQLINVVRGDMSLVGPRPCIGYEVELFAPHHFDRFHVPAGLTGLWQVSARAHSTFGEALDMDVLYAQSHSIGLDLRLLARTPLQLLRSSQTT